MNKKLSLLEKQERNEIKTLVESFAYTEYISQEDADTILEVLDSESPEDAIELLEGILMDYEQDVDSNKLEEDYEVNPTTIDQDIKIIADMLTYSNVSRDHTEKYLDNKISKVTNIDITRYDLVRIYKDYKFKYSDALKKQGEYTNMHESNLRLFANAEDAASLLEHNPEYADLIYKLTYIKRLRNITGKVYHAILYINFNDMELSIGYNPTNRTVTYSRNGGRIRYVNFKAFDTGAEDVTQEDREQLVDSIKMLLGID